MEIQLVLLFGFTLASICVSAGEPDHSNANIENRANLSQQAFLAWCSRVAITTREQAISGGVAVSVANGLEKQSFQRCISLFKR
jgi:hypothetical protein